LNVLIIAKNNGYGLSIDTELVRLALVEAGCNVVCDRPETRNFLSRFFAQPKYDVVMHLERVFPNWISAGHKNWLIPNQERFPKRHINRLRKIDLVLAKTRHAQAIFSSLGNQTAFTGFTSRDRYLPAVEKNWNRFFHLAGGSTLKGTEDILTLWAKHPEWPELVLVQKTENAPKTVPENVKLMSGHIDDIELQQLQNECGLHLCPSRSEGWGHHLHEAMSCGAVVVTVDAPPMNEFITAEDGILVPFARHEPRHLGVNYYVDPAAFDIAIAALIAMPEATKRKLGESARLQFKKHQLDILTFTAGLQKSSALGA
jgi:Glycosyl transferases group 1